MMQIVQRKPSFTPITITLNSREEAQAFCDLIDASQNLTGPARQIAIAISNWFSNEGHI